MARIEKKCWPDLYEAVASGTKRFDMRLADFKVTEGDTLVLREWDPATQAYTGRQVEKTVTFVLPIDLRNTFWSTEELLEKGLVVLSLE